MNEVAMHQPLIKNDIENISSSRINPLISLTSTPNEMSLKTDGKRSSGRESNMINQASLQDHIDYGSFDFLFLSKTNLDTSEIERIKINTSDMITAVRLKETQILPEVLEKPMMKSNKSITTESSKLHRSPLVKTSNKISHIDDEVIDADDMLVYDNDRHAIHDDIVMQCICRCYSLYGKCV